MLEETLETFDFDKAPTALIFADNETGGASLVDAAKISGARIVGQLMLEAAKERLDRQASASVIMLDLSAGHSALSDRLLEYVAELAEEYRQNVIVSVPLAMIDGAAARLGDAPVALLCEPDDGERLAALACAIARWEIPANDRLADVSTELDGLRLRQLADEVGRIARALSSLSSSTTAQGLPGTPSGVEGASTGYDAEPAGLASPVSLPDAATVRGVIKLRRLREGFFDASLFADPAWDMLLDLFAAHIDSERVAVSSLCIAAAVPPTTALRWIRAMTENDLLERHADPLDGRRVFIRLSAKAIDGMARYFAAMSRLEGATVI